MANPLIHAKSSVKRFGGSIQDYMSIHELIDSPKTTMNNNTSRVITHQDWFAETIIPKIYGKTIINQDNVKIDTTDIAILHILEDFRMKFIPTIQDYFVGDTIDILDDNNPTLTNSAVVRWGGKMADYMPYYNLLNSLNKEHKYSRLVMLNTWFAYTIMPKIFEYNVTNSVGKSIDIVDLTMLFISNQFQNKFVPTPQDYLKNVSVKQFMCNGVKLVDNQNAIDKAELFLENLKNKY